MLYDFIEMKSAGGKFAMISAIVMLLCVTTCHSPGLTGTSSKSLESELKAISKNSKVPPHLSITYDDMHGLWGGMTIIISGSGSGERRERARGDAQPQILKTTIAEDQLLELIKLLIELRAWEQQSPEREAAPDESRARLTISVGERTSEVWEWYNEMAKNKRLIRIKERMSEIVKKE